MSKLSKGLKSIERGLGKLIPHQSAASKRADMYAVNEQLSLYKTQRDELHAENERLAGEKALERQKLHEKQIRALKRSYRPAGFMQPPAAGETSDTLG